MEGKASQAAARPAPPNPKTVATAVPERWVPERWVPERILRGHLIGAGLTAAIARCGDSMMLTGPALPGGPLVCRLDREGPCGSRLDEPLAQAACGLMAVHGRGRGRRTARLGVDYVTTATGVVLAQGVLASLLARMRGGATRGVAVSMAATALLTISHYLAVSTADDPDPPTGVQPGFPPPFPSADGVIFELETLDVEPWRLLWTGLGVPETVAAQAWQTFMLRYATAVAPLPTALHAATRGRPYPELACAAAAAGVAVQRLRGHDESDQICGCAPFAAPWTVEPMGPALPGSAPCGSCDHPLAGMVVVEAGRRVQGPLAGHLLGLLGAEVISIEPRLLGRERDGRGRRVRSSLLCAAALQQAQLSGRGPNGRPEFGVYGVPLPAMDGDLVLSRTASPRIVTAALGLADAARVPPAIAAMPADVSLARLLAAGVDAVRARLDPAELASDLWAATLLKRDRCTIVNPPWTFTE